MGYVLVKLILRDTHAPYKFTPVILTQPLPTFPEQRAIAEVLSSLDNKINLLREQNEVLEATAQTIFNRWFVSFEFPDKGGKPFKSSGGIMIDSPLGKIPEGWIAGKYIDLADVLTGKGIKSENLKGNGLYQVLGANGEIGKTDKHLYDETLVLTGRVGTLGTVYISIGKVWISDNVLISKPKNKENTYFAYFQLKRLNFESLNRGSTQPLITQTDIKNVDIIIPRNELLRKWDEAISRLFNKRFENNSQIKSLTYIRNLLLPKLMKGELRVKEFSE